MTFLAALHHLWIEAPCFSRGRTMVSFRLYVEKVLLPTLRPGEILIMDNLGSHRRKSYVSLPASSVSHKCRCREPRADAWASCDSLCSVSVLKTFADMARSTLEARTLK
ncbi:hypothetical protein J6524_18850 [Bradyrhizobium sp. WSM 1738]|nr:hypothetical protein [Bradyrhizobium hereditatis]